MDTIPKSLIPVGLALLAMNGLDWHPELTWYDQHRIEQVVLLGMMAFGTLSLWRGDMGETLACLPLWAKAGVSGAFGLGLVSGLTAVYPRFAILEWATLLLLVGMALVLGGAARRGRRTFDIWAFRLVVAIAAVIVLKIMAGYLAATVLGGKLDTIMLFEGAFSNRRFFGQAASMIMPLLAYPLLRGDSSRSMRTAVFALLAVWWMLTIVSGTRGTWIALAVAATVLGACAWRASAGWLKVQMLALGAGALMFGILFVWLPRWIGLDASLENRLINVTTLSGREVLWSLAWTQIQFHPWLGIGPMHLAAIRNDFGAHPHNAVLQLAAEWGVPAALALILPVAAGMLRVVARLRENEVTPNVLLVCLTGGLLAAGAQSMVDGVIVVPYTQTLLVLVAGWTLGVFFRDAAPAQGASAAGRVARRGILWLQALALAALLQGVFPEVLNRGEITEAYVAAAGNSLPLPRYWAVGWIP